MRDFKAVLQLHLMTEKSLIIKEKDNAYVFRVAREANKVEIKKAIEKAFNVKVKSVRTMTVASKPKRMGIYAGRSTGWKKAIVKLTAGQKIADFENI